MPGRKDRAQQVALDFDAKPEAPVVGQFAGVIPYYRFVTEDRIACFPNEGYPYRSWLLAIAMWQHLPMLHGLKVGVQREDGEIMLWIHPDGTRSAARIQDVGLGEL